MDVSTRSTSTVNEDQTWIGNGGMPIGTPRSIVLDRSEFTIADGRIPSGTPIGRDAATGLFVPFEAADPEAEPPTDGTAEPGYLFASIAVDANSTGDLGAALFWSGEVITANLPDEPPAGFVDATANHIAHV